MISFWLRHPATWIRGAYCKLYQLKSIDRIRCGMNYKLLLLHFFNAPLRHVTIDYYCFVIIASWAVQPIQQSTGVVTSQWFHPGFGVLGRGYEVSCTGGVTSVSDDMETTVNPILFHSILPYSILSYSILPYSILSYSILSIQLWEISVERHHSFLFLDYNRSQTVTDEFHLSTALFYPSVFLFIVMMTTALLKRYDPPLV
jgi:hypothetical protein